MELPFGLTIILKTRKFSRRPSSSGTNTLRGQQLNNCKINEAMTDGQNILANKDLCYFITEQILVNPGHISCHCSHKHPCQVEHYARRTIFQI